MKFIFFLLFTLFYLKASTAQNIVFARQIIDTLTSEFFAGRGYAEDGLQKTERFLEAQFKETGLLTFNDSYIQAFTIPMNVITTAEIQKGKLKEGTDFIVNVRSSGMKGRKKIAVYEFPAKKMLPSEDILKKYSNKIVVFLPSMMEQKEQRDWIYGLIFSGILKASGYVIGTNSQPVWDAQFHESLLDYPVITIKGSDEYFLKMKTIDIFIENQYFNEYPVSNIAGYFPGTQYPDSFIVFCAHYDHLGKMGSAMYPGANDNASGVAMMLDLMRYFSSQSDRLKYSVAFLAMTAEEAGILGATYYTEHPLFSMSNIRFLINLDIIGTGKEGIQVVNGSVFEKEFNMLTQINTDNKYLPQIKTRGEACNSDHCPFYRKGVPSFFIYTLDKEYPWYHVPEDKAENLPLTAYENLFRLIRDFCNAL